MAGSSRSTSSATRRSCGGCPQPRCERFGRVTSGPQERIAELERDLSEALERQSAAAHVLEVLGGSTFELDPVFETVLGQAVRLCRADAGLIYVLDGDVYRVEATMGASQAYREYITGVPLAAGSGGVVDLVLAERSTVQIRDAASDPRYTMSRALEL